MPLEPLSPAAFDFIAQVEQAYASLMQSADGRGETSLGGRLLYAGELNRQGLALACAGNIAGSATLTTSADQAAGKQAMRDGIVDFLVTSLDEALRILKNQIRKRETVAVCVGAAPGAVEREMVERGVVPDLVLPVRESAPGLSTSAFPHPADPEIDPEVDSEVWVTWRASAAPALWLPRLDAIALGCLSPDAAPARRWLQLAPRYLGRLARNAHTLHASKILAGQLVAQMKERVASGEIAVSVEIEIGPWGHPLCHRLTAVSGL